MIPNYQISNAKLILNYPKRQTDTKLNLDPKRGPPTLNAHRPTQVLYPAEACGSAPPRDAFVFSDSLVHISLPPDPQNLKP